MLDPARALGNELAKAQSLLYLHRSCHIRPTTYENQNYGERILAVSAHAAATAAFGTPQRHRHWNRTPRTWTRPSPCTRQSKIHHDVQGPEEPIEPTRKRRHHSNDATAENYSTNNEPKSQNLPRHPDNRSHTAWAVIINQGDTLKKNAGLRYGAHKEKRTRKQHGTSNERQDHKRDRHRAKTTQATQDPDKGTSRRKPAQRQAQEENTATTHQKVLLGRSWRKR